MIKSYRDRDTQALFEGVKCHRQWRAFERVALRKLTMINAATDLRDLASPPANRLEALKRGRKGQHSIRINDQWRVCFVWENGDAYDVEIVDYH